MALEGPQLCYAREDDDKGEIYARALRLARQIEELLEAAPSTSRMRRGEETGPASQAPASAAQIDRSPRMARAMAASLVDELESIVRGTQRTSIA